MATVVPATNRVDTFAAAHGLTEQDLIRWNLQYFLDERTMWLPVGTDLRTEPPPGRIGDDMLVNGRLFQVNEYILTLQR